LKFALSASALAAFVALDDVNLHDSDRRTRCPARSVGLRQDDAAAHHCGMESADCGQVLFAGEEATHLHARDRNVGFVFQHYALFRHMSVFENVAFGLRVKPRKLRPSASRDQTTRCN
jgi:sulfate transport system ATP-binding protein